MVHSTFLQYEIELYKSRVHHKGHLTRFWPFLTSDQSYIYQVLQTIQMKLILLCVWAEPAVWAALKLL